jgi:AcrR family transcriptional regulator
MNEAKKKRTPKQERSNLRKEKILETAYSLYSEIGYFNTTTNDIAKAANIQISSLYSYFKDKDAILLELLDKYNTDFLDNFNFDYFYQADITIIEEISNLIKSILNILIKAHTDTIGFNKELQALYYYKPEVTKLIDNHEDKIRKTCLELLLASKNIITVSDFEATSIICVNLISSTVDTIVFNKTTFDSDRIIDGCIEAIIKYITS